MGKLQDLSKPELLEVALKLQEENGKLTEANQAAIGANDKLITERDSLQEENKKLTEANQEAIEVNSELLGTKKELLGTIDVIEKDRKEVVEELEGTKELLKTASEELKNVKSKKAEAKPEGPTPAPAPAQKEDCYKGQYEVLVVANRKLKQSEKALKIQVETVAKSLIKIVGKK